MPDDGTTKPSRPTDPPGLGPGTPRRPLAGSIDEIIREAMARGDFDNLPGRGRPLNLEGDSSDENFLAQKLLKDAGYVPPWLVLQREIDRERVSLQQFVRELRERVEQAWQRSESDPELAQRLDAEVARRRDEYATRLHALSRKIMRFNLMVPVKEKQMMGIRVEAWLQEFDAELGCE